MANQDTAEKLEQALQIVLAAQQTVVAAEFIEVSMNSQAESQDELGVNIISLGGIEDGHNSGNERLSVRVQVVSAADRDNDIVPEDQPSHPRTLHRAREAAIFDVLRRTDLFTLLTDAVADFTVFDSIAFRRQASTIKDRQFQSELILTLSCCPSDVA